ncbi:MAG: hypothetical protein ABIB71_06640 [Candidatus Woesearchaeota archaeon]
MSKTTQLGLRIDTELLKKIEKMARHESIDKMSWIRRALATFVNGEEKGAIDEAIENYMALRIDEGSLKQATGLKKVPKDMQEARKEVLSKIKLGVKLE